MKIVIDTNVWVSALHFTGGKSSPAGALKKAQTTDVIAICDEIEDEIARILIEKFCWNAASVRTRLAELLIGSIKVSISGTLAVCRDPNDDMVLECAVLARAEAIVSGDKDLLVLGAYEGINILTPAEYLSLSV